ncbi:MAG: DUF3999 family protein [Proteobacteria bacterium]|nr:DUF3999 family protein [Pseudomonadota bacterium]
MRRLALASCILLHLVASAAAEDGFAREREVLPGGRGPQRLAVDAELLAGARAAGGLADLRLVDRQGREVPYLLIFVRPTPAQWVGGRIRATPATKTSSGFELELGRPLRLDRLRLEGLAAPWLKRVRLEGSADRRHWVVLVESATLFDLPDERLRRRELAFAAGAFQYLRLAWDDRSSALLGLPRRAAVRAVRAAEGSPPLRASLPFTRLRAEPGRSRFRVRLPAARLPIEALELEGAKGDLLRLAWVLESRIRGGALAPVLLGRAVLRRAVRGDSAAADLRIPISAPSGRELDLVVDDGNNPPLALATLQAVFTPQPWIYFESTDGAALTARYGHARLKAPRYDLEAARGTLDRLSLASARWGAPSARFRPSGDLGRSSGGSGGSARLARSAGAPATEDAPRDVRAAGPPLPLQRFRYRRELAAGPGGLRAVPLDAAVLAHAHGLRDLRLVDAEQRQLPYLLEARDEPIVITLHPERLSAPPRHSAYRLRLPFAGLPAGRLVLSTQARVFRRQVQLLVAAPTGVASKTTRRFSHARLRPREPALIAASDWSSVDPEERAPALYFELPRQGSSELRIMLAEGDNTPLPLAAVRLLLPARRLRFYRPARTRVRLLYGDPALPAPQYDLSLLAPLVLNAPAEELALGPEHAQALPAAPADHAQRYLLALLIVTVLILLALIVHLVRKSEPDPPDADPPEAREGAAR